MMDDGLLQQVLLEGIGYLMLAAMIETISKPIIEPAEKLAWEGLLS